MGIGGKKEEIEPRKVYFEDGQLGIEYQVNKKGQNHGFYKVYHRNGQLHFEVSYTDGIQNGGTVVYFHSNGVKATELNVKKGRVEQPYVSFSIYDCILDGEFTQWNEDGSLENKGCYKDAKLNLDLDEGVPYLVSGDIITEEDEKYSHIGQTMGTWIKPGHGIYVKKGDEENDDAQTFCKYLSVLGDECRVFWGYYQDEFGKYTPNKDGEEGENIVMENIEDIKNLKIYTYEMESWHNYDSNTEKKYLRIVIKETPDFCSDDYEDYFKEHFNEIKGKTAQEFMEWLEEKRWEDEDEIAEEVIYILEELEHLSDSFFDEENEEEKEREELYKDGEEFGLANSQPVGNSYFYSIDEVKKDIIKYFPYTKSSTLFEEID